MPVPGDGVIHSGETTTLLDALILMTALLANGFAMDGVINCGIRLANYRRYLVSLLASGIFLCAIDIIYIICYVFQINGITHETIKCLFHMERSLEMIGFITLLLNCVGIFFDHFIGIVYPHHYGIFKNNLCLRGVVFLIWIVSVTIVTIDFSLTTLLSQRIIPAKNQSTEIVSIADLLKYEEPNRNQNGQVVKGDPFFQLADLVSQYEIMEKEQNARENATTNSEGQFEYSDFNALFNDDFPLAPDEKISPQIQVNIEGAFCSMLNRQFFVSLEVLVLALVIAAIIFMSICQASFSKVSTFLYFFFLCLSFELLILNTKPGLGLKDWSYEAKIAKSQHYNLFIAGNICHLVRSF